MLQCGLLRSNFALAIVPYPSVFRSGLRTGSSRSVVHRRDGAGEGNRTLVISLEGFCSAIELHPPAATSYHCLRSVVWGWIRTNDSEANGSTGRPLTQLGLS